MRTIFVVCVIVFAASTGHGQQALSNLPGFNRIVVNPAFAAIDDDLTISFSNERTRLAGPLSLRKNVFTTEVPLINQANGRRYAGLGIHLYDKSLDDGSMRQTFGGFSACYNLIVAHSHHVAFGIQTVYATNKYNIQSFTSGNQWIAQEFRHDPSLPLGEAEPSTSQSYLGISSGMVWYVQRERYSPPAFYTSIAAHNLNRPLGSSSDKSIQPVFQFEAGGRIASSSRTTVKPLVIQSLSSDHYDMRFSLAGEFNFINRNGSKLVKPGSIEIVANHEVNEFIGTGLAFHQPVMSVGVNYNIPIRQTTAFMVHTFEFALMIRTCMWKGKSRRAPSSPPVPASNRTFEFENEQNDVTTVNELEDLFKEISRHSDIRSVQFELEKDFRFAYGRSMLDEEGRRFLDELFVLLRDNPSYVLQVIGHTDTSGKASINYKLSMDRAEAVARYLREKGLDESRIATKGAGDTQPISPNDTPINRAKNRRVQFIIAEKRTD